MIPTAYMRTYNGLANWRRAPVRPVCALINVTTGLSSGFENVRACSTGADCGVSGEGAEVVKSLRSVGGLVPTTPGASAGAGPFDAGLGPPMNVRVRGPPLPTDGAAPTGNPLA